MIYTHQELEKFVECRYKGMSKEEQYERLKNGDPLFEETVLGQTRIKDSVDINHEDYTWSRINKS